MPHFQGTAETLTASRDWAAENRPQFIGAAGAAIMSSFQRHNEEKEKRRSADDEGEGVELSGRSAERGSPGDAGESSRRGPSGPGRSAESGDET
jgi:hypothetical protein